MIYSVYGIKFLFREIGIKQLSGKDPEGKEKEKSVY